MNVKYPVFFCDNLVLSLFHNKYDCLMLTKTHKHRQMTVDEYRNLVMKGNPDGKTFGNPSEQRPFTYNNKQMVEIFNDLADGFLQPPIILSDVDSSLLRAIQDNNSSDIKYFQHYKELGISNLIWDGQHRTEYLRRGYDKLISDKRNEISSALLDITFLYNWSPQELERQFNSSNSGRQQKSQNRLWSIVNQFNQELKELLQIIDLIDYQKAKNYSDKERMTYGTIIIALKICGAIENLQPFLNFNTDYDGLKELIESNFGLGNYEIFLQSLQDLKTLVPNITNEKFQNRYLQLNYIFALHVNRHKQLGLDVEKIRGIVDTLAVSDDPNSPLNSRSKKHRERYLEIRSLMINFTP